MATEDLFISLPDSHAVEVHCTVLNRIMLRTWDTSVTTEHVMLADLRIHQAQARTIAAALLAAADEQDRLDAAVAEVAARTVATKSQRINAAFAANELTWESPLVDIIDALVYDGDFSREEADAIACAGVR